MDLLGIAPSQELNRPEGISPALENTGQEFAGIFAEAVNGLVPIASEVQLPIAENSAELEKEQAVDFELLTDSTASQSIADNSKLPVMPQSKFSVSMAPVEIFSQGNAQLSPATKFTTPFIHDQKSELKQSDVKLVVDTLKNVAIDFDFAGLKNLDAKVESSDSKAPLITIDGKEVSKVGKPADVLLPQQGNDYLSRLNLKEIYITTEKAIEASAEFENRSNSRLILEQMPKVEFGNALINPKSTLSNSESKQNAKVNGQGMPISGREITAINKLPEFETELAQSHDEPRIKLNTDESEQRFSKIETNDKFEIALENEQIVGQVKTEQNTYFDSKISTGKTIEEPNGELKTSSSVRVILPENLKQISAHQKNSIMIKIEPAHLGPAQLDLHMRNEILTARLTVETTSAKSTLENSINTLKEQFAKADIKVEQIEINVRGETNYNQLFNRQPQWQKFSSAHQARFNADDLLVPLVPVNQIYNFRQNQYVGTSGVNVLA